MLRILLDAAPRKYTQVDSDIISFHNYASWTLHLIYIVYSYHLFWSLLTAHPGSPGKRAVIRCVCCFDRTNASGEKVFIAVTTNETQHISNMVSRQKAPKKVITINYIYEV